MRIVVFGAGGFVGGWVSEEIAAEGKHEVVACVRRWSSSVRLARRGIAIERVSADDTKSLANILAGADALVNASMPSENEAETALALYEAAAAASVKRFVHFSTTAVYGNQTGQLDESVLPKPADDYGRAKAATEAALLKAARDDRPQIFILRPSIIYGPFSSAWTVRYARRIRVGRWKNLGSLGAGTCNLIHGRDVARAAIAAAVSNAPPGPHVLNLSGGDPITWNEYIDRFGQVLGILDRTSPNIFRFRAMTVFSHVVRIAGSWAKRRLRKLINAASASSSQARSMVSGAKEMVDLYPLRDEVSLLKRDVVYEGARAEEVIGFKPIMPLAGGLQQTAEWCKRHGIV